MDRSVDSLFHIDSLLASEYLDTFRNKNHLEPETRLMFAVLSDAINDYRKYAIDRSARGRRLFREVEAWIHDKNSNWLFSFENICDSFKLDPDFLRKGLRRWRESRVQALASLHLELRHNPTAMAS